MRLLTHNLLMCNLKSCTGRNFPLVLQANEITEESSEFNQELTLKMLNKIDWRVFHQTLENLGHSLPEELNQEDRSNEALLQRIHHLMFNIIITTGTLICQNCNRAYPIDKGIPNMLLEENEEL